MGTGFENIVTDKGHFDEHGAFHPYSRVTPEQLNRAREAESARVLAGIEARQKREAAEARAKERAEQERGRAELDRYEVEAKAAYLASGGDSGGWLGVWSKLKTEYLADRARERMTGPERRVAAMAEKLRASGVYDF